MRRTNCGLCQLRCHHHHRKISHFEHSYFPASSRQCVLRIGAAFSAIMRVLERIFVNRGNWNNELNSSSAASTDCRIEGDTPRRSGTCRSRRLLLWVPPGAEDFCWDSGGEAQGIYRFRGLQGFKSQTSSGSRRKRAIRRQYNTAQAVVTSRGVGGRRFEGWSGDGV